MNEMLPYVTGGNLIVLLAILTVCLLVYIAIRAPELAADRTGKVLIAGGFLALPAILLMAGTGESLNRSTSTEFCLSCHEMQVYKKSLLIDDNEPIPAVHYQNRYVPREHACYTCHSEYTMFGGVKTKINGLRHLYYHYIAGVPEKIEIVAPLPNRTCLSCHAGARSFTESENHDTDEAPLAKIVSGEASCLASGCHDVGHAVDDLDDYEFWTEHPQGKAAVKGVAGSPANAQLKANGDGEEEEEDGDE